MKKLYDVFQEYQKVQEAIKALQAQQKALAGVLKEAAKNAGGELQLGDVKVSVVPVTTHTIRPAALAEHLPELGLAAFKVDNVALRKVVPEKYGVNRKDAMDFVLSRVPAEDVTTKTVERLQIKAAAL